MSRKPVTDRTSGIPDPDYGAAPPPVDGNRCRLLVIVAAHFDCQYHGASIVGWSTFVQKKNPPQKKKPITRLIINYARYLHFKNKKRKKKYIYLNKSVFF